MSSTSIKGRILTRFPMRIVGGPGTSLSYEGGILTIDAPTVPTLDQITLHGANISSAATLNLEAAAADLIDVTGTTTVTAITLSDGHSRTVRFTGALTLTHSSNLVLPTAENILTAAGDVAVFRGYASSVVRCTHYTRASGQTVANDLLGTSISVSPAASTFDQGYILSQTLAGTVALPDLNYGNAWQVSDNSNAYVVGFNLNHSMNTATWKGPKTAFEANSFINFAPTTTADGSNDYNVVAGLFAAVGNVAVDPAKNISLWGVNPGVNLGAGCTGYGSILGSEYNLGIQSGASAVTRIGIQVISNGPVRGTTFDAAYVVGATDGTWKYGYWAYNNSFSSTSTIFYPGSSAANYGIDFRDITFSTQAIASTGFTVGPSGATTAPQFLATAAPTASWTVDASGQSATVITNGGNASLAVGAGLVVIHNQTDNEMAMYLCGGGIARLITGQTNTSFEDNTATPSASHMSLHYPGSGNAYIIYNNMGHSVNVKAITYRTQTTA